MLQDMVPPKKHLLRHQPANAQIGLMEGNTFCTTLQPRLFTMDLNVVEHKVFYTEVGLKLCTKVGNMYTLTHWCSVNFLSEILSQLLNLCEAEDAALMKLPCYKSLPSLVPLRIAALSMCYFFIHIYKNFKSSVPKHSRLPCCFLPTQIAAF